MLAESCACQKKFFVYEVKFGTNMECGKGSIYHTSRIRLRLTTFFTIRQHVVYRMTRLLTQHKKFKARLYLSVLGVGLLVQKKPRPKPKLFSFGFVRALGAIIFKCQDDKILAFFSLLFPLCLCCFHSPLFAIMSYIG
jgi:hypothetical protein